MKSLHPILYTSALWFIGGCLGVIYSLTHDVGDLHVYQLRVEAPVRQAHVTTAADIFSPADEAR